MKSKLYRTLLFCVGSALVTSTAFAQADATTQQGGTSQEGTSTQLGTPKGRDTTGRHSMMHGPAIRASKTTGAQVKSSTGETLGTIEDIIFNPRTGQAEFAVISLTNPAG